MKRHLTAQLLFTVVGSAVHALAGTPAVNADSAIIQDFQKRVDDYLQLRKKAEAALPAQKATASPAKITHQQNELARAIRRGRANAKQGDIFTPPIAMEIRRLLTMAMGTADAPAVRQSLQSAEPVQLHLNVGETYPDRLPLQSTPPTLLANLPKLPPEIEYRITGQDLVLLDTKANLIVDVIHGVFS